MNALMIMCGAVFGAALLVFAGEAFPESTILFKKGQIECANGKMYYELKNQSDSSVQWERKR